jgi:membrane protein YqaA with SNARE-associated domain
MAEIGQLFQDHSFITLFAAAFTPIPYKVFTIAAGLFHIDILLFTLAAIIGRGARFGVIGYAVHRYGKRISTFLYDYFNLLSLVILLAIVVILFTSFK